MQGSDRYLRIPRRHHPRRRRHARRPQRKLKLTSSLIGKSVTHLQYDVIKEKVSAQAAA